MLREENDEFIGGEQLRRALIEREQDEVLDDLGKSVTRLGAMGMRTLLCTQTQPPAHLLLLPSPAPCTPANPWLSFIAILSLTHTPCVN